MSDDEGDGQGFVEDYLPYLLAQAAHATSYRFHVELKKSDIREAEWRTLSTLSGTGPIPIGTLEAHVLAPQSTLSRTVDRLAQRGLVERSADTGDRRVVMVSLSEAGKQLAARLIDAAKRFEAEDLSVLSEKEADDLRTMLARLFRKPGAQN